MWRCDGYHGVTIRPMVFLESSQSFYFHVVEMIIDIEYIDSTIFFITDQDNEPLGISIDSMNNWITYERIIEENIIYDVYLFKPADVNITLIHNENNPHVGIDMGVAAFGVSEVLPNNLATSLQVTLKDRIARQARRAGRELASVKRLPTLPNTASVIGRFISGVPGSLNMQRNRLRRNTGTIEGPIRLTRSEVIEQARQRRSTRRQTRRN